MSVVKHHRPPGSRIPFTSRKKILMANSQCRGWVNSSGLTVSSDSFCSCMSNTRGKATLERAQSKPAKLTNGGICRIVSQRPNGSTHRA